METPETADLAVAALVVGLALVAFIAVLWLNRDSSSAKSGAKAGSEAAAGTVFTDEGGRQVRRSTRARKSVVPDEGMVPTPPAKAEPKVRVNNINNGTCSCHHRPPQLAKAYHWQSECMI